MRIIPGGVYRLPSGNVVQLVSIVHQHRLVFRYLQTNWHQSRCGVVLSLDWVRRFAREAA